MKFLLILILLISSLYSVQNELKYGKYRMKDRSEFQELLIKSDSTFLFKEGAYGYSYGTWSIGDEKLVLNSKTLTREDSLIIALSSGSFFRIDNKVFSIKKRKLIDSKGRKFIFKEN